MTAMSWIVEVRERLAAPPPTALATEGARFARLVPLFVDGGELWLLLLGPNGEELVPGSATLPEAPVAPGEEPWPAAESRVARLGLDATAAPLRLGTLDSVPSLEGDVVIPCVVATPPPPPRDEAPRSPPLIRLPLRAARTPNLLEERPVVVRGVETWATVAHIGPVKLAGVEVEIVNLLLERLFQG